MATPTFPSPKELIIKFLTDIGQYHYNMSYNNPMLIDMDGKQMYVYIKNLSPAQLSNDNPDIWRIQLPMRKAFEEIKNSNKMFVLLGYDYIRKVYTTWNPYWCKQRLNVAESCSMYSRISLQRQVSLTQKIERRLLQNEGDVICIPPKLLSYYLKNIKEYYPEESTYVPIGSSIQKRKTLANQQNLLSSNADPNNLFEKFQTCFDIDKFKVFLSSEGFKRDEISNYSRLAIIFENGFIKKYEDIFLECTTLNEYKRAINRFCWQPDIRKYDELWNKAITKSLLLYLRYVEKTIYGTQNIELNTVVKKEPKRNSKKTNTDNNTTPKYELDQFGKLVSLDAIIIDKLLPLVREVDFPDYVAIIKQVKEYYPEEATGKMTPADWMKLFDSTKWRKKRGRKAKDTQQEYQVNDDVDTVADTINEPVFEDVNGVESNPNESDITIIPVRPQKTINFKKIESVFDKKVTSYKYFWLMAILTLINERGDSKILYKDILIRMAAIAWPIVIGENIDLGKIDMMSKYLSDIQKKTYLIKNASGKVVETTIKGFYINKGLNQDLAPLLNNVPYRFLSPWVKYSSNEEVFNESKRDDFEGPYVLYTDEIVLNTQWKEYIQLHYEDLCRFTYQSFLSYVKQHNNVFKLLNLMRKGWKKVIEF